MIVSTAFDPATLPIPVLVAFVAVTHLGNPLLVTAVAIGLYWLDPRRLPRLSIDRRHAVALLGVLLCSAAVVEVGKTVVDVSRPPAAGTAATILDLPPALAGLSEESLERGTNSFPSGHTVTATVMWGGLGVLAEGSRRRRAIAAGTLVALVAASRYFLGVHHLTDLAGGLVVGGVLLGVFHLFLVRGNAADLALGLATLSGGGALLLLGAGLETIAIFGIAAGATVAWQFVGTASVTAAAGPRPVIVGLAIVLPLWAVVELAPALPVAFVAIAVATAGALFAPVLVSAVGQDVRPGS